MSTPTLLPPELRARRAEFAADTLELEAVLELYAAHASSSLGRRALAELGPRDEGDAREALARAREMQRLEGAGDAPSFAGVGDPFPEATAGARLLSEERLLAVRAFADAGDRLREWFEPRAGDVPALARVAARIPELAVVRERIDAVLDERGAVREDASPLLQRLSRDAADLARRIDQALRELLGRTDVKSVLSDAGVHRRSGRPVLAVKAKSAGRVRGLVHDRSQSGETVFVEPREVIELGNRLAETRADRRRELERILLELTRAVQERRPEILSAALAVAEIELASISARFAIENGGCAALQPGDPHAARELVLRAARHPLLLREVSAGRLAEVVPIDLRLGADFDMLIITGPNTGGKTLALKTAGLFALLTRAGLSVPASEGTTIPLYSGVAADIGDEQEISQNLSTFASHMVRVRRGLERADARTLVLLDELGGGTDPDEGAALGEAILERFLERGVPTIASTHLGKLKEFAFRRQRAENACTEFDAETLEPRYRLLVGTPGESGALVIARRLGLPADVIQLAGERIERRGGELAELFEEVRRSRAAAEVNRARTEDERERAARDRAAVREKQVELERRGDQLEKEAQRGIEERVRDALRQLEAARGLLGQMPRELAANMAERLDALERDISGAALSDRRAAFLDELDKGKLVYLPRYRQRVLVQKVDRKRREVTVKLGAMKMKVPFDEVTWYESL